MESPPASLLSTQISASSVDPWARISIGKPASWVLIDEIDHSAPAKEGNHVTFLNWERQVHVGSRTSFHRTTSRLESPQAVQSESQWQLPFRPQQDRLTLHWVRIVREGTVVERLERERIRIIQRENQLEHLVIDGAWTILLVLDDVRPGDVLDTAYSFEQRHPIHDECCDIFFYVPPYVVIGRYRLSIAHEHDSGCGLSWKGSPETQQPREEILANQSRVWTWSGQQLSPRDWEPNQPSNYLDYQWIQATDRKHWQDLSRQVAKAWHRPDDGASLGSRFACPSVVDETAIHRLIRQIQDNFRYLSIDLEAGGWVPAPPAIVADRRYGDCKDLAWLAANILRTWKVHARPILVGSGLRDVIASHLPSSLLFNHAVLEVEVSGKTRWFDLTHRNQGGDFNTQWVAHYGYGLPVDAEASGLIRQPGHHAAGIYAVRETIYLDTNFSQPSTVEVLVRTEGWQSDNLRKTRYTQGADEFAKERLKQAQARYGKVERKGPLLWRDNRETNICELAELLEIQKVVYPDEDGKRALFDVPINLVAQWMPVPEAKPRRTPWELPFPMELRHNLTVCSGGMGDGPNLKRKWSDGHFTGLLEEPRLIGGWSKIARYIVERPHVEAAFVDAYRATLVSFVEATYWRLYLPPNHTRKKLFEKIEMPALGEGAAPFVGPADPAAFSAPEAVAKAVAERDGKEKWWKRILTFPEIRSPWLWFIAVWLFLSALRTCALQ